MQWGTPPLGDSTDPPARSTTAADISPRGDEILIKSYTLTFLWRRPAGTSIAQALMADPCPVPTGPGEAITFTSDGSDHFTVAEGGHPMLVRFDRR